MLHLLPLILGYLHHLLTFFYASYLTFYSSSFVPWPLFQPVFFLYVLQPLLLYAWHLELSAKTFLLAAEAYQRLTLLTSFPKLFKFILSF